MITGKLQKNENGRWEIVDEGPHRVGILRCELTSGDVVELCNGTEWVTTRIESKSSNAPPFTVEYYAVDGSALYTGKLARVR
jgi:hypothetical protein